MKKLLNYNGFSMAESVISVAILGAGILGFYKVNEMMNITTESSSIVQEMNQFTGYFYSTLNSSKACKNSFNGLTKGTVGEEVMDSFTLKNALGDEIVTATPRIVDSDTFPSLYIMNKSIIQAADNQVKVSYFAVNPEGPEHKISYTVEVAYDFDGNFSHCINNESRTNAAICESVSGTYNYIEDKCNFFNLYSGNYSAQQCEGLGGEILKDEETGTKYCNKGTDWYRKKEETTTTSRRKVDYKIVSVIKYTRDCLATSSSNSNDPIIVCPDLPENEIGDFQPIYQNTMAVTKILRSASGDNLFETFRTTAYTSPTYTSLPPEPTYNYNSETGDFDPPTSYSTSNYYSSPTQTRSLANANMAIVEDEYRFEKLYASTKTRTRVEYVVELPDHLKQMIEVSSQSPSGPGPTSAPPSNGFDQCDPNNPDRPATCDIPDVEPTSFFGFLISSAYAAPQGGEGGHTTLSASTPDFAVYTSCSDKPTRHLNNQTYGPEIVPSGITSISPADLLNSYVYFKITYEDVVTEEKIERFQTVYY